MSASTLFSHFKIITVDEYHNQQQSFIEQSSEILTKQQHNNVINKRGPGRPKRSIPLLPPVDNNTPTPSSPTRKRTRIDWFSSPYIHDILDAVRRCRNYTDAINYLQSKSPQLPTETEYRFARLHRQTMENWFDEDFQLLPQYQKMLENG